MKKAPTTVLDSLHHCWGLNWHKTTVKKIQWCLMLGTLADDLSCPVQPPSLVPVLYSRSAVQPLPPGTACTGCEYAYGTSTRACTSTSTSTVRKTCGTCFVLVLVRVRVQINLLGFRTPHLMPVSLPPSSCHRPAPCRRCCGDSPSAGLSLGKLPSNLRQSQGNPIRQETIPSRSMEPIYDSLIHGVPDRIDNLMPINISMEFLMMILSW